MVARSLGLRSQLDAFRGVARDDRIAAQLTALVPNRRDNVVAAVARAVLAHVPAFLLVPAFPRRDGQLLFGRRLVVRWVQQRKRLPDRFRGAVAVQCLRTRVPARNASFLIEHVDRAIADRVDDELHSGFALTQLLLDVVAARDVALQARVGSVERAGAPASGLE